MQDSVSEIVKDGAKILFYNILHHDFYKNPLISWLFANFTINKAFKNNK